MSLVVKTLKPVDPKTHSEVDVELYGADEMFLSQRDEAILLDRRQRQELLRVLEEWGPK